MGLGCRKLARRVPASSEHLLFALGVLASWPAVDGIRPTTGTSANFACPARQKISFAHGFHLRGGHERGRSSAVTFRCERLESGGTHVPARCSGGTWALVGYRPHVACDIIYVACVTCYGYGQVGCVTSRRRSTTVPLTPRHVRVRGWGYPTSALLLRTPAHDFTLTLFTTDELFTAEIARAEKALAPRLFGWGTRGPFSSGVRGFERSVDVW